MDQRGVPLSSARAERESVSSIGEFTIYDVVVGNVDLLRVSG
jgi:hypothetical protein